jgi:DNA-binding transcriptional MocR family regulator
VSTQFSERVADLRASPIREILSVIDRPGMVSFAGGLPAAETFPTFSLAAFPSAMMQYGSSEGEPELRERVAEDLNAIGLECSQDQVLILSGSQQGIDLVSKLFIDPGTDVAVESPTYLAALQVFRFFGARFLTFDPRKPNTAWPADQRPSFVYTIPTFQNPTGRCYSTDERDALPRACDEQGVPLFEDDPHKRYFFANALQRHLGKVATWEMPPGGLFFWLKLTRPIDTRTLLPEAIQRGVAFMPGEAFFPDLPESCGSLRLNFSHADEEKTERGLAILAKLLS